MDTFNVPMLAESSSNTYATEATSNHHHLQHQQQQQQQQHQQQQQQQLLMPHHHKDQMLAAGSTPMLPFYSHLQLQQKDATATMGSEAATVATAATSATADNFSSLQTIDASQLDGGISLSGLCDRFFVASPNPHSNSNMTLMGTTTTATTTTTNNNNINNNNNNNNNNNIVEAKAVRPSNGGSVIIESVTMPSFANILFPTHRTANECIDPALLQKNPQNNTTGTSIIVPPVEYHQLKPLAVNSSTSVSTSNFLSSTTAQLLDFEVQVGKDDSHISTTTTGTGTGSGSGSVSGSGATTISTATPTTITTTSNNNTANPSRSSLHSIEELAASSCAPKTTSPNSSASTTPQQHHQHQQQQQQQHHMQSGNHSGSNLSTDDESMSEDEFGLEIDDNGGYQDTTSSHSQQSGGGGGGGGGNLLNGSSGGSSAGGGYMLLSQAASSSGNNNNPNAGHMSSGSVGNGGPGNNGGSGGNSGPGNPMGGTSATPGHGGEVIDFKHLFEELCPVCGDKVSGYHYGLLTCESCKGFFKRTVQNKKVYTCVAERSCHIDKTQRKRCPYCRFQKCLEVGMKLEAVRADRMRGGRNKFGPMYKRDRARKLQVMRQRQLALQALRNSMGPDIKPTPISPGYQQAYPNMNIKQEIQIPQVSSLTQSPDSSPSPIAIALGQVNASTGGVIATPMNAGNGGSGGGGLNGPSSVGNGNSSNGSSSGGNNNSSTGNGASGGGGGGGNNAGGGGGGGGGGTNSVDGLHRNGGNGNSSCHEAGIGSLQNTADSKLCFDSGTHPSSTADALIEPLRVSPMIREFVQSIDDREWQTQLFALLQKQTYNQVEVDLFELMCKVLDQNLFSQVDWARNTVFFKDLKVDDQMKLLQHSWSDMLVLDHLHHRIHNGLPDETQLNNGQVFNLMSLGLLGVPQLGDYFNELQNKLQDLKFDMGDYVCMKFLILLNPTVRGIVNRKTVSEGHDNVQAALLDYTLTCYPSVNDKFRGLLNILPEIHALAARGEDHLYSKHREGSAPTQTLLMEMLHAKRKV
ncbi:LOW QUALITY PROTEIN: nuclear hormone receptor FTZ-F1 [Drosophila gunungcola]|uniref:LOW QUALITY PROTEIN: nuclear hormone receptor FTZ-F1 n=1 Tax=Drosophila gunungcola TaxID=103775 RepID=UPI0022E26CC7|nr:LOW QUALITY PROTEIN: nuclear hormone receptor FTZ-F1 [Drosophila gunungcola]